MNPYEDPDGGDFQPHEDSDSDMITMNPSRWQGWRPRRPIAVAGVAVVALAGGAGIGYAATHSPRASGAADAAAVAAAAPSPSATPSQGPVRAWHAFPGGLGPLGLGGFAIGGGVVHGQLTVPKSGGGYQTVDVQNGKVTAVSTGSVSVKSADGFTATYTVTSKTLVTAEAPGIASVKKGDTVFVTATISGSTATAASVIDLTDVKAGRASFHFPGGPGNMPKAVPAQPPSA